jgi:hypothetical protein
MLKLRGRSVFTGSDPTLRKRAAIPRERLPRGVLRPLATARLSVMIALATPLRDANISPLSQTKRQHRAGVSRWAHGS